MAAIKLAGFLGEAPKISPELLPNTAAQSATNCKLYSGDLIPYTRPVVVGDAVESQPGTIYPLRNPDTNEKVWLAWGTDDVDVVVATSTDSTEQRFYYSGDGVPKVSNYELATVGNGPYPTNYYDLGLPLPTTVLTVTATPFTQKTVSTFTRDGGNVATLVTTTDHGFKTGSFISVSGFTDINISCAATNGSKYIVATLTAHGMQPGDTITVNSTVSTGFEVEGTFIIFDTPTADTFRYERPSGIFTGTTNPSLAATLVISGFNARNVECTVINSTTFTYFSPGFKIGTFASTTGKVDLGGLTQARSYVYTWLTPWDEESIGSKPSTDIFVKEGVTVTVTGLPSAKPTGNNFVRGVNLYRTLSASSGTEYYRLATLWFPTTLASIQRTSNVSRVSLVYPHNLSIDDRFKISGCGEDASFNITDGIVTDVIDIYTFEYSQVGSNVANTLEYSGVLYHDVSENPPTTAARYWGDGSYDFTDDFDARNLLDILETDNYDPPPEGLRGLTSIQNNILAGFVGNTLYFSEPNQPHAWPAEYSIILEHNIVGLAPISGSLLVTTDGYPYIVSGSDPANGMASARIDAFYPCLRKQSIVAMGYGVVYATHDGLAVYSPSSGPTLITKALFNNDTWQSEIDPTTVSAVYYGQNYLATYSTGIFVFEQDARTGGFFTRMILLEPSGMNALRYDGIDGKVYFSTYDYQSDIYEWDNDEQPVQYQLWKSKVLLTNNMVNLGAARIIADYTGRTDTNWEAATFNWEATGSPSRDWDLGDIVLFTLYVDKEPNFFGTFQTYVTDSQPFRLPTGYRTDTFEVSVTSNIRIRAIHLAETMLGLREV